MLSRTYFSRLDATSQYSRQDRRLFFCSNASYRIISWKTKIVSKQKIKYNKTVNISIDKTDIVTASELTFREFFVLLDFQTTDEDVASLTFVIF